MVVVSQIGSCTSILQEKRKPAICLDAFVTIRYTSRDQRIWADANVRYLSSVEYHEIFPMEREDLERLLDSGNEKFIIDALLSAAFYDPDWKWIQTTCLRFLDHPEKSVRWNAATCLGHIARIHRQLDIEIVLPRLMALKADPSIAANVEDALDDIKWYLRPQ
jgi:hypothetical protein